MSPKKSNKGKKSYKSKRYNKKSAKTTKLWTHNLIVPDRYFVPLELEFTAYMPASQPTSGFFWIQGNSLYDPFGNNYNLYNSPTNYTINSGSTTGGTCNFTPSNSSSTSMDFKGVSQLNTLYNKYKVNWSKVTIMTNLSNASDCMQLTIVPFANSQNANFSGTKPVGYLSSVPYSKEKVLTNTSSTKDQIISCSMSSRKILGMNKYQYGALPPLPFVGFPTTQMMPDTENGFSYFVQYNVLTGASTTTASTNINFVIKMKVLCEFSERIQQGLN